jgi:hypothetical protein
MSDKTNLRSERIEKLLHELRYEVCRGMIEHYETLVFQLYVPISDMIPDGVVLCEFSTRPMPSVMMQPTDLTPLLRIVK